MPIVSGIPINVANTPAVPELFLYRKYAVYPKNNTQIKVSIEAIPIWKNHLLLFTDKPFL